MISVIVNTYNEEKYLDRCLSHLTWADEIVVVDMYSSDKSVEIARKYTDKIFYHERTISVLYARNFSLSKASGDWVLIVDPDEVMPQSLGERLRELSLSKPDFKAVAIPFQTICFGKELKHTYPLIWKSRFLKKDSVDFPKRVHSDPVINGTTYHLPAESRYITKHYVAEDVYRFVEKMNRYTSDEAMHLYKDNGARSSIILMLRKPIAEFINYYFKRKGYKDGIEGFIFSVLMAVYRFLIYIKLWELDKVNYLSEAQ